MTTTPQPQVDIEELEALAKASAATWAHSVASGRAYWWNAENFDNFRPDEEPEDARFIAAANPSTVLALITETRALRAVKLRVHDSAEMRLASRGHVGNWEEDMREIERITR